MCVHLAISNANCSFWEIVLFLQVLALTSLLCTKVNQASCLWPILSQFLCRMAEGLHSTPAWLEKAQARVIIMHKSSSLGGAVLLQDVAANTGFGGCGGGSPSDDPEVSLPTAVLWEQNWQESTGLWPFSVCFKWCVHLVWLYVYVYLLTFLWTMYLQVPMETRGWWTLWNWRYRQWGAAWVQFWKPNPGPQQVLSAVLTAGPSQDPLAARMSNSFPGYFLGSIYSLNLYFCRNSPNI